MARHASGKNNYALSGGVIAALVVAVLPVSYTHLTLPTKA